MKYLKILTLAAVAALAIMAMAGASAASAKVCSLSGTGAACGAGHGNEYTGPLNAELETGKTAVLTSTFVNVTCKKSSLTGEITSSSLATGFITSLTFSECSNNLGQTCTATTTASSTNKWHALAVTDTAPNGHLEVSNVTGTFKCGETDCIYASAKVGAAKELLVAGGSPAVVTASAVPLERETGSSSLCSATAKWDGTYKVTSPTSLYLT